MAHHLNRSRDDGTPFTEGQLYDQQFAGSKTARETRGVPPANSRLQHGLTSSLSQQVASQVFSAQAVDAPASSILTVSSSFRPSSAPQSRHVTNFDRYLPTLGVDDGQDSRSHIIGRDASRIPVDPTSGFGSYAFDVPETTMPAPSDAAQDNHNPPSILYADEGSLGNHAQFPFMDSFESHVEPHSGGTVPSMWYMDQQQYSGTTNAGQAHSAASPGSFDLNDFILSPEDDQLFLNMTLPPLEEVLPAALPAVTKSSNNGPGLCGTPADWILLAEDGKSLQVEGGDFRGSFTTTPLSSARGSRDGHHYADYGLGVAPTPAARPMHIHQAPIHQAPSQKSSTLVTPEMLSPLLTGMLQYRQPARQRRPPVQTTHIQALPNASSSDSQVALQEISAGPTDTVVPNGTSATTGSNGMDVEVDASIAGESSENADDLPWQPSSMLDSVALKFKSQRAYQAYQDSRMWVQPTDPSLPTSWKDKGEHVLRLKRAMMDTSRAEDTRGKSWSKRWAKAPTEMHYSDEGVEAICWEVVNKAVELHRFGPGVLNSHDPEHSKRYENATHVTFQKRMGWMVEYAMRSKARIDTLMKHDTLDTFVAIPHKLIPTSKSNRGFNVSRARDIQAGKAVRNGAAAATSPVATPGGQVHDADQGDVNPSNGAIPDGSNEGNRAVFVSNNRQTDALVDHNSIQLFSAQPAPYTSQTGFDAGRLSNSIASPSKVQPAEHMPCPPHSTIHQRSAPSQLAGPRAPESGPSQGQEMNGNRERGADTEINGLRASKRLRNRGNQTLPLL